MAEKEYIECEALKTLFAGACAECRDSCAEFDGIEADCNQCLLNGVIKDAKSIPAADVRSVVRGKWEEVEVEHAENIDLYPDLVTMRCGKCNRYHTTLFFYGNPTALMNFCPVCGADMREKS